jgi:hypothetical protein
MEGKRNMRDGLYKVAFQTQLGAGAGVVVLQGGKLKGGDSRIYYTGSYTETGDQFTAQVATELHTDTPGFGSIFGRDHANISLRGTTKGDSAEMTGTAAEQELSLHQTRLAPGVSFQVVLTRIAD